MQKEVLVALEGFEDYFEYLSDKVANIETEKQEEIAKLVEEVDKKYEHKFEIYKKALSDVTDIKYEEVPDAVEEEVVETEAYTNDEPLEV